MKSFFNFYFKTRPFAYGALFSLIKENSKNRDKSVLQKVFGIVANNYNEIISKIPLDERKPSAPKSFSALISDETSFLIKAYEWYLKGKVTYRFSESLTDLLAHTDVMDEVFHFDKLPYESFFLDFSNSATLITLEDKEYKLNGVFISKVTNFIIEFSISLSLNQPGSESLSWFTESHPIAQIGFEIEDDNWSIGKLIDENLKRRLDEENNGMEDDLIQARLSHVTNHSHIFKTFSPLIFNSITYLLSESPDLNHEATPPSIQKQLNNIQNREKKTIANLDLLRDNKFKFYHVGKSFESISDQNIKGTGQEKNRHWRRGHWRNQAYGANHSLRKIIWVKPTIIRADRSDPFFGKSITVE